MDAAVPLRRNRDFVVLWSSQALSVLGRSVTTIAYPLLALATTGSPAGAGLVGFAQALPMLLFYLPAGALVDRWDRRRVMLVCEAVRAAALGALALAIVLGNAPLVAIAAAAFVEGTCFIFFNLAEGAALPHIVPREQLPAALAQNEARTEGAELLGQPLGGALFQLGRAAPFALDALTYLIAFAALATIRRPLQDERTPAKPDMRAEVAEGVRFVWREPLLRPLVFLLGGVNLVFGAVPLAVIVHATDLGASPALIGLLFSLSGAGAIAGALLTERIQRRVARHRLVLFAVWLWVLQIAVLSQIASPILLGVALGAGSIVAPVFNVVIASYRYEVCPDRLQGRVVSAARLVAWGGIPFGALLAGGLLEAGSPSRALVALAGLMALIAVAATATPVLRRAWPATRSA